MTKVWQQNYKSYKSITHVWQQNYKSYKNMTTNLSYKSITKVWQQNYKNYKSMSTKLHSTKVTKVWHNYYKKNMRKLERLQKYALNYLYIKVSSTHSSTNKHFFFSERFQRNPWTTLTELYLKHKTYGAFTPEQDNDKTTTRQKLNLCISIMSFTPGLSDLVWKA